MCDLMNLTHFAIGLAVFGQQLCLPLPSILLLMTAGALAGRGEGHLAISLVLLSSVLECVAADSVWFWLGRRWGSGVIRLICSLTSNPQGSRERSRRMFDRWGLRLLLVAKFVPLLDGVSPPLAGAQGATLRGFLTYDTVGSLLWSTAYVLAFPHRPNRYPTSDGNCRPWRSSSAASAPMPGCRYTHASACESDSRWVW